VPVARGNNPGLPVVPDSGPVARVIPPVGVFTPEWWSPAPPGEEPTRLALNPPGNSLFSLRSVAGLGAAPVDIVSTPAADGGVIVEFVRPKERTILWPIRLRADTHDAFVELWRATVERFTVTRQWGPGRLRLTRPDGTAREIPAVYSSGFEMDPEEGAWTQVTAVVNLLCPSPFWRATAPTGRVWEEEAQPDYLAPYPTISSGQVIGSTEIRNDGHEDAWPFWTVRGPLTSLVAANTTRGESFTLTHTLTAGQTMTMSSRPIQVRGPAGERLTGALNLLAGGIPWRINARSVADIVFTANGSEPESAPGEHDGTSIGVSFHEQYETA
jgi:hypothetical protein